MDVYTGESSATFTDVPSGDSLLGMGISHIHKLSSEDFHCGNNFHLSLHEKLDVENGSAYENNYIYTDSLGFKHGFRSMYYYLDSSNLRVYIKKEDIKVGVNGEYYFVTDDNVHNKVYVDQFSTSGLQIAPNFEKDIKGAKYFEQVKDEQKQIEEQYQSYRATLAQYILTGSSGYHRENIRLSDFLDSPTELENVIAENSGTYDYWMTESESNNLRSLNNQYSSYTYQIEGLLLQQKQYTLSVKDMEEKNKAADGTKPNFGSSFMGSNNSEWPEEVTLAHKTYNNCQDQIIGLTGSRDILSSQISASQKQAKDNLTQIQKYYKDYLQLIKQKEQYDRQIPVNYLTDGKIYKGFNKNGLLVAI